MHTPFHSPATSGTVPWPHSDSIHSEREVYSIFNIPPRFEDMNRLISARKIKPIVDRVFSFDQAKEAYEYLASQKHVGKVVIRVA